MTMVSDNASIVIIFKVGVKIKSSAPIVPKKIANPFVKVIFTNVFVVAF